MKKIIIAITTLSLATFTFMLADEVGASGVDDITNSSTGENDNGIKDTIYTLIDDDTHESIKREINNLSNEDLIKLVDALDKKSELTSEELVIQKEAQLALNAKLYSQNEANEKSSVKETINENLSGTSFFMEEEIDEMTKKGRNSLYEKLDEKEYLTIEEKEIKDYIEDKYILSTDFKVAFSIFVIAVIVTVITSFGSPSISLVSFIVVIIAAIVMLLG